MTKQLVLQALVWAAVIGTYGGLFYQKVWKGQ